MSKLLIPELIFCVVAVIGYYSYYFVKYRKTPKMFMLMVWGVGAYFLYNAFSNAMMLVFVQGVGVEEVGNMAKEQPALMVLVQSLFEAISIVFIGGFILNQMHKRNVITDETGVNMTGYIMGAGSLFTPFLPSSLLMLFIQAIVNVFVVITNPTGENLNGVTVEQFNTIKEFYKNLPDLVYLSLLLKGIVFALLIFFVIRYLYKKRDAETMKYKILAGTMYLALALVSGLMPLYVTNYVAQSGIYIVLIALLAGAHTKLWEKL